MLCPKWRNGMINKVLNNGGIALHTNLNKVLGDNLKHQIRHPVEIFDIKIKKIVAALKELNRDVQAKRESCTQFDIDELTTKKIFDYVQTIDELYDSAFLMIKSLNATIKKDNKNAIIWCKENCNVTYSDFRGSVDRYHDLIRVISNKAKHDSLRVDFVTLIDNKNNEMLGFYFSNVIGENNLNGADVDIHQQYKESSTAFSYNYFISFTIGLIFYIMDKLNASLFKEVKLKNTDYIAWNEGLELLKILGDYNENFFPDEYNKYCTKLEKNKHTMNVRFPYKANMRQGCYITSVLPLFRVGTSNNEITNKFPYHRLIWA